MPKTFTDSERSYIKTRLMEEAEACLSQFGLRKTTVDELVRRVNIPKGTFYLFYPSKEMLIFDVFHTLQDELHTNLLRQIEALNGHVTVDSVTDLMLHLYQQVNETFLYSFAASGDLELLIRKLPEDVVQAHVRQDDFSMEKLLSMLPGVKTEGTIKLYSAALRGVFFTMSHRREIGETVFDDTMRLLLRGVILQLFEGESL